ncbi:family 16 glycosylhydrolase [Mariniluteicoccus flavus]
MRSWPPRDSPRSPPRPPRCPPPFPRARTSVAPGATATPTPTATHTRTAAPRAATQLTEDFTGPAGSPANPAIWGYDTGRGFQGWGNWEKQFYTDTRNNSWLDGEGHLVIQAKYEAPGATMQYGDDAGNAHNWETRWTSARLVTRDRFEFTHGRAEARIKVPQGAGMWPAFWSLGADNETNPWPNSGEIDIFESKSDTPTMNLSNVFGGNAWNDLRMIDGWTQQGVRLGQDFHTVALEWTPDTLQFFFDGRLHHEVTRANMGSDWRFDKPVYLILNVAVGGGFGGAFNADSGKDATLLVDHVRVTGTRNPHPTGALAISKRWTALGGLSGRLGDSPRTNSRTRCDLVDAGCVQHFDGGLMYWNLTTGAHPVWGEIGRKYADLGWERSLLGYPTGDELCGLRDGGCVQNFQGGYIYWTPKTGTQVVWGAIAKEYADVRWETSPLGYPTGGEVCGLRDGGCVQHFQGGYIYWSPKSGAHAVWGAIAKTYADVRWETSVLGYPTTGEVCGLRDGGCVQQFQDGYIYWTPGTGGHAVWGAIARKYADVRWETSTLGYAIGGEFCGLRDGGCGQRFQGGYIYWSPATGAHPVWGAIGDLYAAQRWEQGSLGYPTSDELVTPTGWEQRFQGGVLTWRR